MAMSWQAKARERLNEHAQKLFHQWVQSKQGAKWVNARRKTSPYQYGFSLPDYHHDLIAALNADDEERAKSIMLQHYV